ncbi:MAG: hypothetical protein ACJ74J_17910 [Blastocatellia bacterium]
MSSAALMLVLSVMLSASAQAQNRDYDRGGQNGYQGQWSRDRTRDYAMKLGYHTGYSEVRDASQNGGSRRNLRDIPGYRNDSNGYLSWMNYRDDYRSSYRRGFEMAYQDFVSNRPRRYTRQDVERALGRNLKETYNDDRYDRDDWYPGRRDDNRGGDRDRDGRNDRNDRDGRNDRNDRNDHNEVYRVAQQNGYREGLRQGQDDANRRRGSNYENDSRYRDALSGYRAEYGNRDDYRRAFREGFRQGYEEGYRNRR